MILPKEAVLRAVVGIVALALVPAARADDFHFDIQTQGLAATSVPFAQAVAADGTVWFDVATKDAADIESLSVGRLAPNATAVQELPVPGSAAPALGTARPGTQIAQANGNLYFLAVIEDATQKLVSQQLVAVDPGTAAVTTTALPATDAVCVGATVEVTGALVTGADGALRLLANCGQQALIGRMVPGGSPVWSKLPGATEAGRTMALVDGTTWFAEGTSGAFAVGTATTSGTQALHSYAKGLPPALGVTIATIAPGPGGTIWLTAHDATSQSDVVISMQSDGTAATHDLHGLLISAASVLGPPAAVAGPDGGMWLVVLDPKAPTAPGLIAEFAQDGTLQFRAALPAPLVYGYAPIFAPDGRLWFDGLSVNGTAGRGSLVRVTLPAPDNPAPPSTIASAPAPVETTTGAQLALACAHRHVTLLDVVADGRRVRLRGAAETQLAGQKVAIVQDDKKTVATATVGADGYFTTTARLPGRTSARYRASAAGLRSAALKLSRRLVLDPPAARNGRVTLTGHVLGRATARLEVRQQTSCGAPAVVAHAKPDKHGRFRITVTAPAYASAAIYRLATSVHNHPTFSLPQPVDLD